MGLLSQVQAALIRLESHSDCAERRNAAGNPVCFYCGRQARYLYKDHIVPRSWGGSDYGTNFALVCDHCNMSRNNREPFSWFNWNDITGIPDNYLIEYLARLVTELWATLVRTQRRLRQECPGDPAVHRAANYIAHYRAIKRGDRCYPSFTQLEVARAHYRAKFYQGKVDAWDAAGWPAFIPPAQMEEWQDECEAKLLTMDAMDLMEALCA